MAGAVAPAGAPPARAAWPAEAGALAVILVQLILLVLVVRLFRIESPAFYEQLAPYLLVAFLVHHLLPASWRLAGFVVLSLGAIVMVFGARAGGWLIAVGLALIMIARLPVAFGWRVALLVLAGAGLALARAGVVPVPWSAAIWPILASMFMFRLAAYMYDARHARTPVTWRETLAYFFLLPNVAFPLFPVVDFATFRRTRYDQRATAIYQAGIVWMARGLTHLIVYRLVYQQLTMSPAEVTDLAGFTRYALANFGLYLRVSGQFHLIVGILHLFGFRLPESHRFFYLASSFSDFWRRINIYWKDFMQKVVFYPVHFRLKRRGESAALTAGTLAVFLVTWLTHSYQWFWILGTWLVSLTDTLFWGLLAIAMVISLRYESRHGRARPALTGAWSWRAELGIAARTALMFTVLCLLWTLWTAPSLASFVSLLAAARPTATGLAAVAGTVAVIMLAKLVTRHGQADIATRSSDASGRRSALGAIVPLIALTAVALPGVSGSLPPGVRAVVRDLKTAELNRRDAAQLQRGYYEQLVGVNRFNGQLWEVYSRRTESWPTLEAIGAARPTGDILARELVPFTGTLFRGQPFRTNRWGMRDQDYDSLPRPGTIRVAVLGASLAMGDGIGDGESFEAVAEERLNAGRAPGGPRIELLNYSMRGYTALSQVLLMERGRPFALQPDAILFVVHGSDRHFNDLDYALDHGLAIPLPGLEALLDTIGVRRGMPHAELERRLQPHRDRILAWAYRRIAELARQHGVPVWWVNLPLPLDETSPATMAVLLAEARAAGFTVLDVGDPYAGHDPRTLILAEWDRHPNTLGHALIADRLTPLLAEQTRALAPSRRADNH